MLGTLFSFLLTVAHFRRFPPSPFRPPPSSLKKLPGKDSNLERGNQNPLCYHYTTGYQCCHLTQWWLALATP